VATGDNFSEACDGQIQSPFASARTSDGVTRNTVIRRAPHARIEVFTGDLVRTDLQVAAKRA